jgi:pimeloyl-ACP methyl ester carboxylesterase
MIFHRFLGGEGKPPCVILHGLLGSSRNWLTAGKILAEHYAVYALDLRNHGQSPHCEPMDYPTMANDLHAWAEGHLDQPFLLIGHSMGGKVAMYYACKYNDQVSRLAVVDIAAREYPPRWEKEFAVMKSLPLEQLKSRAEAEKRLEEDISDWAFRKFLATNLTRDDDGKLAWSINLDLLQSSLPSLFINPMNKDDRYPGPVVLIRGAKSRFVKEEDMPAMRHHFPEVKLVTIADAGHNVHFDHPQEFCRAILS